MRRRSFLRIASALPVVASAGLAGCGDDGGDAAARSLPALSVDDRVLSFASDGAVLEAVPRRNLVREASAAGAIRWTYGGDIGPGSLLSHPTSITASDGVRYVTDSARNRIVVLDAGGVLLGTMGGPGSDPGRLTVPGAVVVGPDRLLYVPDAGNRRVQVFDASGGRVRELAAPDPGAPVAAAFDAAGLLHVVDATAARVDVMDTTGRAVRRYGMRGMTAGGMRRPVGIAIDASGRVVIPDPVMAALHQFDGTGGFVASRRLRFADGRIAVPRGVVRAPDGTLRIHATPDRTGGRLHRAFAHVA